MRDEGFSYDSLVEGALRGVVRDVLRDAAERGLPGAHHFYISFRTDAPGVQIPASLLAKYPQDMTIVLQHQYWDLKVEEDRFFVTLSFNNQPTPLEIPFSAMTAFVDPSVKFGLQFASAEAEAASSPPAEDAPPTPASDEADEAEKGSADVVALDRFRR